MLSVRATQQTRTTEHTAPLLLHPSEGCAGLSADMPVAVNQGQAGPLRDRSRPRSENRAVCVLRPQSVNPESNFRKTNSTYHL